MISILPVISNSFSPQMQQLRLVSLSHLFLNLWQVPRIYRSFFLAFIFTLWSAGTAESIKQQFFFFFLISIILGLAAEIKWCVCISKPKIILWVSYLECILVCAYTIPLYRKIQSLARFSVDHLTHPVVASVDFLLCQLTVFAYFSI